jgi:hypothetical protein
MSKIAVAGNASGTGTLTIAAPNTNSDRTLTLPDVTATVITDSAGVLNIGSGQVYKDGSGNVGIGTSSPLTGLSLSRSGTQWTNNSSNTYPVPAGRTFVQMEAVAAQANWFGFTGAYGATSGSANLLLQVNLNNTSQQAGNYIASEAQSATAADLTFGKMVAGATTGANSEKSEQMRITSAGNVGIGTTSPDAKLDVTSVGSASAYTVSAVIQDGTYPASGNPTLEFNGFIAGNGYRSGVGSIGGQSLAFYTPSTYGVAPTERMRIDSSGNVGIGTSSPSAKLSVVAAGDNTTVAVFGGASGGTGRGLRIATGIPSGGSNNEIAILDAQSDQGVPTMAFQTAGTERMRIDSSGNLLVGTTSASSPFDGCKIAIDANSSDGIRLRSAGVAMRFIATSTSTFVGSITTTASATSYNTSSDYRLKEDWVAVADASTRVNALKPVNFAWKVDGSRVDGFLAHEVAEVVPEAITGEKDAVDADGNPKYQGIDQSKLVPLLTAALQEALARIETLEADVATLKGAA